MPTLNLDDAEIYYETHGEGRPFLFNAATATCGELWKFHQVEDFRRDHRVIIFDQRGTGRSPVRSNDFSTPRLAADAAALLRHLDARDAIVLGHSNGGRVAQSLALDYPEFVGKLILASSGGTHNAQAKGIPLGLCLELVERGYERFSWESGLETGFTASYRESHRDEVERFMKLRAKGMPTLEIFLRHVIGRQEYDSKGGLEKIQVPCLVMVGDDEDHGGQSSMTHFAFAKQLAQEIPTARLVVLKGQGHYYYFSAPEETNRIMREFLTS
jgi:pimeloyl-ACP methyl ester carboxylesterase